MKCGTLKQPINHINEHGQMYGVFGQQGARMNFNHEILWATPEGTEIDSHEVKQIPNGNYMACNFGPS